MASAFLGMVEFQDTTAFGPWIFGSDEKVFVRESTWPLSYKAISSSSEGEGEAEAEGERESFTKHDGSPHDPMNPVGR